MKDMNAEKRGRDAALDALEDRRADLITTATDIAMAHAIKHGNVTSVDVFDELRKRNTDLGGVDPRWMGAVFREGKGWRRVGWAQLGSHGRAVAVWELKP